MSTLLADLINSASDIIETWCDRELISRGTLTEYHTFRCFESELYLRDWPIIAVTDVAEDIARTYGTSLTVNTQYIVTAQKGKLTRTWSATSGETAWQTGFRAVRVQYTAGYEEKEDVPDHIKDVCKRLVALKYREVDRKHEGLSGASDDAGNWTRFGTADLTDNMRKQIYTEKRNEFSTTGERDS